MLVKVSGCSTRPCSLAPPPSRGGHVASHVAGSGVSRACAGWHVLAVADRRDPSRPQLVSDGKAGLDPIGPDNVGLVHAERAEGALTDVAVERGLRDLRDDLPERCKAVIRVRPLGARVGVDAQARPVLGQAVTSVGMFARGADSA